MCQRQECAHYRGAKHMNTSAITLVISIRSAKSINSSWIDNLLTHLLFIPGRMMRTIIGHIEMSFLDFETNRPRPLNRQNLTTELAKATFRCCIRCYREPLHCRARHHNSQSHACWRQPFRKLSRGRRIFISKLCAIADGSKFLLAEGYLQHCFRDRRDTYH
jgi:hypothetical protein